MLLSKIRFFYNKLIDEKINKLDLQKAIKNLFIPYKMIIDENVIMGIFGFVGILNATYRMYWSFKLEILMVEDDSTIAFAVKTYLNKYNIETIVCNALSQAYDVNFNDFDLIILDANLPDGSGFDFLKWLREFSDLPVIMLTVKNEDEYVIKGLSQGADDYITKPFSLPVLKARIDNVFSRKIKKVNELTFENLSLDFISKQALLDGIDLDLNLKEFAVLEMLLENQKINLPRERILDYVWGYDFYEVNDNTLTVTIKRLRSKLGDYGNHIKTLRGIGYRWDNE